MTKNQHPVLHNNSTQCPATSPQELPDLVNTALFRKSRRTPGRSPVQRLALEPRIVFDGAGAVEGLSMVERQTWLAAIAPVERTTATQSPPSALKVGAPSADVKEIAQADIKLTPERQATEPASPTAAAASATEIVFVSGSVSELQTFLTNRPGTEVVLLDPNRDGMEQIAASLSGRTDISAIHILSHGQAGQLFLGTSTLSTSSITGQHADELATIKAALTDNADILIYGCDAGSGTTGQNFIDALASATGADVAASTDKTGAAELGGNWVLEAQTGRIETDVVMDIRGQADYRGLLAPFTINAATAPVLTVGTHVGGPLNGNIATYNNVGTTVINGATVNINLVATITSSTAGDTVNFSAVGGSPSMQMSGGTDGGKVNVHWELVRADNGQPFVADIKITIADIDGAKPSLIESVAALQTGVVTYSVASVSNLVISVVGGFIRADGTASQNSEPSSMIQYTFANTPSWDITYYTAPGYAGRVFNNNGSATFVVPGAVTVGSVLDLDANDSTATGSGFQRIYIENSPGVAVVDTDVSLARLDGTPLSAGQTYTSATVVLTNAQLGDVLSAGTLPAGITAAVDTSVAGKITVTLSGSGTPASYLSALQAITFSNTTDAPALVARSLLVTVLDGATLSNSAASTINISRVNDAPVNTLPATFAGTEDATLSLAGLSVVDPDGVATTNHTVTLSVPTGTLTATGNANVTVTGTGTGSLVLTGTLANINAYLASTARPNYVPVTNFNGDVVLTMTTSDGGNIGTGGIKTDTDTSIITLAAVNDAPVNTLPATFNGSSSAPVVLAGLSVSDVDVGAAGVVTTNLSVTTGTLAAVSGGGVTVTGSGTASLTLSGSVANINAFLLATAPTFSSSSSATLTMLTSDGGNTGSGGAKTDSDISAITIIAGPVLDLNSGPTVTTSGPTVVPSASTTSNLVSSGNFGTSTAYPAAWVRVGNGTLVAPSSTTDYRHAWTTGAGTNTLTQALTIPAAAPPVTTTVTTNTATSTTVTTTTDTTTSALTSITFDFYWQNGGTNSNNLTVSYGGAVYATITTGALGTASATIAPGVGATATLTGTATQQDEANGTSPGKVTITFTTRPTASGNLVFAFVGGKQDDASIDNVVATSTTTTQQTTSAVTTTVDADRNWAATYAENGLAVAIADTDSSIFDGNNANMTGATATLTNPVAGDRLLVNGSTLMSGPTGIGSINWTRSADNTTVTLTGTATKAQYADAIELIKFDNTTENPTTVARIINVTATNGAAVSNTAVTTINVTVNNDAPVAVSDTALINTSTLGSGNVLTNDTDVDAGDTKAVTTFTVTGVGTFTATPGGTSVLIPGQGTLVLKTDGSYTFNPVLGYNGAVNAISYIMRDTAGLTSSTTPPATLTITVAYINVPPTNTLPAAYATSEDTTLALIGLSIADVDAVTGNMTVTLSVPQGSLIAMPGGSVTVSGSGTGSLLLTGTQANINNFLAGASRPSYMSVADFNGTVQLTMVTSDLGNLGAGGVKTDTDVSTITVNAVADITTDTLTTIEREAVTANLITGTNGATADTFANLGITLTAVTQGANGSVTFLANGTVTYTPTLDYTGPDSFTYTVTSGGVTETATVNVTVNAVNTAPTNTLPATFTTDEDTAVNLAGLSIADPDAATGNVTVTLSVPTGTLTATTDGTVTVTGSGTGSLLLTGTVDNINAYLAGAFSPNYNPEFNFSGNVTLTMTTNDGGNIGVGGVKTDTDTSIISVLAVNDAPLNNLPGNFAANEDTSVVLAGISIFDFDSLTGTMTVTFSVPTGSGTLFATALAGNPVTVAGTGTASLTLTGSQADINAYLASASAPSFKAVNNFNGDVVLTMVTSDGGNLGSGGVLLATDESTIAVNPVNDAPVAVADVGAVSGGAILTITAASGVIQGAPGTDTDVDNATGTLQVSGAIAGAGVVIQGSGLGTSLAGTLGHLTLNADGSYTYVADNAAGLALGATATDTFTYTVTDPVSAVSNTATLTITVTGTRSNTAPVVSSTSIIVNEESLDTPLALVAPTDADSGDTLIITVTALPSVGTVTLANGVAVTNGQILNLTELAGLQFDAPLDLLSAAVTSFKYSVNDGSVTVLGSTAITVNPVNDAPVVSSSTITVNEESVNAPMGLIAPTDIDGNSLTITVTALPTVGTVTLANGVAVTNGQLLSSTQLAGLRFSAPLDLLTTANTAFSYRVFDGTATVAGSTSITVNTVNDAPANTVPGARTVNEDTPLGVNTLSVNDVDGNLANTQLTVINGKLTIGNLSGATVSAGSNGSATLTLAGTQLQINAALASLSYQAVLNYYGSDTLTMLSTDSSGNALTSTDSDTVSINVVSVSDAPTGSSIAVTILEDTATVVTAASFGFADASDAPASSLLNVIVTSLPPAAEGVYRLNGAAITSTQVISAADINAGLLTFTPALNVTGTGLGALGFRVQDNGGTANGGVDTSASSNSLTFNVTAVNDVVVFSGLDSGAVSGTDAQVKESDLSTGSTPAGAGETATGTFNLGPATALASFKLGADPTIVTLAQLNASSSTPIVRTSSNGTLTINGYNASTGVVSYSYTLTSAPTNSAPVVNDSFAIATTDVDGDVLSTVIAFNILDDMPVANADVDEAINIAGNPSSIASGNVFSGVGGTDPNNADGNADTQGADTTANPVTGVVAGAGAPVAGNVNSAITGINGYGSLTLNANGSYVYTPDYANATVAALLPGATVIDTFTYEITDSDGDKATTTLTITIVGVPAIVGLGDGAVAGTDGSVLESNLGTTNSPGSTAAGVGTNAVGVGETLNGSFQLVSPAFAVTEITVGTTVIPIASLNSSGVTPITIAGSTGAGAGRGTLIINGYNATTGLVSYQYLLNTPDNSGGTVAENFAVSLRDSANNVTPPKNLGIAIVDDAPIASADIASATENTGTTAIGNVFTSDRIGADGTATGGPVTAFANSVLASGIVGFALTGSYGALTLSADGSYGYLVNDSLAAVNTLQLGQSLLDTFTYTITDGDGNTATASLTITINGANDAPIATTDTLSTSEETPLVLSLAANDTDVDSSTLTVQSINGNLLTPGTAQSFSVPNGSIAVSAGGVVTFTPATNFTGSAAATSFSYVVQDSNGGSAIGTVNIAVTAINDAPVNTLPANIATNEDISVSLSGLQISDVDAPAGNVTVTLSVPVGSIMATDAGGVTVTGSGGSSIVLTGSVAQINTYLSTLASSPMYAPASNANGAVTLTMVTNDGGNTGADPGLTGTGTSETDTDTVTINITPVDDVPTATLTQNAANDTGSSATDSVTSNPSPAINGTGAPGDTITLFAPNNTVLGTAVVDATGNWSIVPSGSYLIEGLNTLSVKATDTNGNQGAAVAVAVTLDVTSPALVNGVLPANALNDSGASASDNITNNNAPTLTGVAEAGDRVAVTVNGVTYSTTALADGSWSVAVTTALADGSYTPSITATDTAGNSTTVNGEAFTVDTSAPALVNGVLPANALNDSGASASDNITNNNAPTLTGVAEAGDRVAVTVNGVTYSTTALADGSWSVAVTTALADGSYTPSITATDTAGNSTTVNGEAFTVDTSAPVVTVLELGDRNKTAAEATSAAGITTVSSLAGSTSVVTLVGSAGTVTKTIINDGTALPVVLTGADLIILGQGAVAVTTVTTDTAGNITTSANTADGDFTLDTLAAAITVTELGDRNKTAAEAATAGGIITVSSPVGSTSVVTLVGSTSTVTKTITNNGAAIPVVLTAADLLALGDGAIEVTTVTTDVAGNVTISPDTADGDFTLDTTVPGAPTGALTANAVNDSGVLGDGLTNNASPALNGTGTPGDTITLYSADGSTVLGTALVSASGTWSIDPATDYLSEGVNTLSVKATDPAGNQGAATSVGVTLDTIATTVAVTQTGDRIKTAAEASSAGGILTVSSPAGSTSVVTLAGSAGTITRTITNDGTALPVVLTGAELAILGDGAVEVTTVTTDAAGNITTSPDTADGDFTLDTLTPAVASAGLTASAPSDTGILGDATTSNPSPSISGTGNPGDVITLFAADGTTLLGTALVSEAGTWSISPAGNFLTEGSNILSVRATDPAGNTGAVRGITLTLDRSLPTVVETADLVRSELFETSALDPTKILLRANTSLHVQQTVASTQLAAVNNPGMRVGEVDTATAAELMGAMGNDLFIVMDAVQNDFSNLTDVREHSGKGLEIKQSRAIFVAQAVHQQELTNDHLTLVHYAVRTSQLEAAARAAMVQVASNSALVGTTTLFDAFAIGAPQPAVTAVPDVSTEQAKPTAKAMTTNSKGAQFAESKVSSIDAAEAKSTLSRIGSLVPVTRRPMGGFASQIRQISSDFKPRRVDSSLAQTERV